MYYFVGTYPEFISKYYVWFWIGLMTWLDYASVFTIIIIIIVEGINFGAKASNHLQGLKLEPFTREFWV